MKYGLNNRNIHTILEILNKYPEVREVFVFGSRAMGTHHAGSDIDLAVMNEGVSSGTILRIISDFEESTLPYFVDVVNYPELEHKELREHINRAGKKIYARKSILTVREIQSGYKKKKSL